MTDKGLLKELVVALRSGDYRQGRSKLNWDGEFCCLGVLTDICVKKGLVSGWKSSSYDEKIMDCMNHDATLPLNIQALTELSAEGTIKDRSLPVAARLIDRYMPFAKEYKSVFNLTELNDKGATFEEIADLIEEQFIDS